uniref:Uncharacterized protein n=1 Tax=Ixodes ricinus TaxID=34613 RepID=A0A147BMQ7_IXORI
MWQAPVPPQVTLRLGRPLRLRQSKCCDYGDTRVRCYFLPRLLVPTVGIVTSDGATLRHLRHSLVPLRDWFRRGGGKGCQTHRSEMGLRHHSATLATC